MIFVFSVILDCQEGKWGRYLCMVRSRSLGKWSGTTICGLALCPDIYNNCFASEQVLNSRFLEGRNLVPWAGA